MPLFQKGTSDKLTNGAPLPGLADDPYVHNHGVKSSRWGVRQELSEARSTCGAARWQRENVTSTTGAISRLLQRKHGTLNVQTFVGWAPSRAYTAVTREGRSSLHREQLWTGNLASTPAGRQRIEKNNTRDSANATRTSARDQIDPRIRIIRVKSDARTKTAVGAEKRRYRVTRHRRIGRGEEVDDNGNAAPVCAAEGDRDVEVGACRVRQEDTPARCETISLQAVKSKDQESDRGEPVIHWTHGRGGEGTSVLGVEKWGHEAPTSHTIGVQKEKQEGSPVTEVGCPLGGAKSNNYGVPVTERAAAYSLTKRELRHGASRWGNLDIERWPLFGVGGNRIEAEKDWEQVFVKYVATKELRGGQKIEENMKWNAERARWRHNVDSLKNRKGERS
ncbi:hypothetical protein EDB87DRAFT_1574112 [Lactarius vividus]|nr:hypothetical protein EDB87DRAFT_1574112 [Lactarius vividus]